MLKFITGRSGFGKTEWIYGEIERRIRETDEQVMLLVPEQFSFETERTLLGRLGPKQAMRVDAYSFSRLAENVFRQVGGLSGERLSEGGKAVLMSLALSGLREQLSVFSKSAQDPAFITMMLSAVTEWKQACIAPEQLLKAASGLSHPNLRAKAKETALIYEAYDALVTGSYLDPMDELTKLRDALRTHRLLEHHTVMVDAFRSFTGQELAVLEEFLIQCPEVTVALCLDRMDNTGLGLFYPVEETAKKLKGLAKRNGVKIVPKLHLTEAFRFRTPELSALEHGIYRNMSGNDLSEVKAIEIYSAANPYEEADIAAESIHRLLRTHAMRFGDFAIIARNTERYRGIIDTALEKYGIAYYMSKPERIDAKPLFVLVFSALTILSEGFHSDEVFRYLKTGLAGLSAEEISDLENYVLLWRKSGAAWREERWADHPQGFAGEWRTRDREALEQINESREKTVRPLRRLKQKAGGGTATEISRAIFDFLTELKTDRALMAYEQRLTDAGEHAAAGEQPRLWDILMELLDQMARTAGDAVLSLKQYLDLFRLVVNATDISFIPQTQDSVIVGNADTIRAVGCKCVLILGANEGVFPQTELSGGLFSDYERNLLIDAGLPLVNVRESAAAEERLYAYAAMTAPSERLFITYSRTDAAGGALQPSSIVSETQRVMKGIAIKNRESLREEAVGGADWVEALAPAFEWTARHWGDRREPFVSLRSYFSEAPDYREKLEAIDRAANRTPATLGSPEAARALFGADLSLSATRIDTYHNCRYRFFLRYGLRARPRGSTEVDPLTFGNVVHFVLEHAVQEGRENPEAYAAGAASAAQRLVAEYVEKNMGGPEGKSARFAYLVEKMIRTVRDLIVHIMRELQQSEFVPVDFELSIGGEEGAVPFPKIELPGGGSVAIQGNVDRVDIMEQNGKKYLRVIDYKTGKSDFSLSEVLDGLRLQMFLYLMCLERQGKERYGEIVPAGVLYMPAKRQSASLERDFTKEALRKKQETALQMKGLVLNDLSVLRGMDESLSGRYIPVKMKSDGSIDGKGAVAGLSDFGRLFRKVERIVVEMATAVHDGELSAVPMKDACAWCDFRSICRREDGDPEREPEKMKTQEVLDRLREEGEEDGKHGENLDGGAGERD